MKMSKSSYYALPGLKRDLMAEFQNPQEVITLICRKYDLEEEDLLGPCRQRDLVFARHLTMYALKYHFPALTQKKIASFFGRDHTSVIHAFEMIKNYIKTDSFNKRAEILSVL